MSRNEDGHGGGGADHAATREDGDREPVRRRVVLAVVGLLVVGVLATWSVAQGDRGPEGGSRGSGTEEPVGDQGATADAEEPLVGDGQPPELDGGGPEAESTAPASATASPPPPPVGPDGALPTAEPVPLDEQAEFTTGVIAVLDAVERIQTEAQVPGEISGPGLAFTVRITNETSEAVPLSGVTVNLLDAEGAPGLPMSGPPARAFQGELAPGDSVRATYVFATAEGWSAPVRLEVSYSTDASVVVFEGDPA